VRIATILSIVLLFVLVFCATEVMSQEKSYVTVTGTERTTDTMIVGVVRDGKAYSLTCNLSMPDCIALKNGRYQVVELPKNNGFYECQDVDVYAESASPKTDPRLGEYCLEAK
jgi:hypothetical protein